MTEELFEHFEPDIEALTLVPSDGGRFEFSINGELLYSKKQLRRHAEPGEIRGLVQDYLDSH